MSKIISLLLSIFLSYVFYAQTLQPGFQKEEFIEMLKMNACQSDTIYPNAVFRPERLDLCYRSPEVGLRNRWDLWINETHTIAAISIRGTAGPDLTSWMENFYIGMIPAQGTIHLNDSTTFDYKFSTDKKAAVHAGWTIGLAAMADDILQKIDSCYKAGICDFLIAGHSQGGAISYLLTAQLRILQQENKIPKNIRFKTYCFAAPKPGNLFFAYNYEVLTRGGWAFNVVNTEDWVPELPFSVQTTDDFSATNPFVGIVPKLRELKFPFDMVILHMYRDMDDALDKARKKLKKYLGEKVGKFVGKKHPEIKIPTLYNSQHYVRTGNTIVLYPKEDYYKKFPKIQKEKIFKHHSMEAYLFLSKQLPD